mgnify:CR=1 FL=1
MEINTPSALVESWLLSYIIWKTKIEALKIQLTHIPGLTQRFELVAIHGKGQKNEAILNEVIKRAEILAGELPKLEKRIRLMDNSFNALPLEEREMVQIRYIEQMDCSLTMKRLNLTARMYYLRRKKILNFMYESMGGSLCLETFQDRKEESSSMEPCSEE